MQGRPIQELRHRLDLRRRLLGGPRRLALRRGPERDAPQSPGQLSEETVIDNRSTEEIVLVRVTPDGRWLLPERWSFSYPAVPGYWGANIALAARGPRLYAVSRAHVGNARLRFRLGQALTQLGGSDRSLALTLAVTASQRSSLVLDGKSSPCGRDQSARRGPLRSVSALQCLC